MDSDSRMTYRGNVFLHWGLGTFQDGAHVACVATHGILKGQHLSAEQLRDRHRSVPILDSARPVVAIGNDSGVIECPVVKRGTPVPSRA